VCGDVHVAAKLSRLVLNAERYDLCQRLFLGASEHPVMTTVVDAASSTGQATMQATVRTGLKQPGPAPAEEAVAWSGP